MCGYPVIAGDVGLTRRRGWAYWIIKSATFADSITYATTSGKNSQRSKVKFLSLRNISKPPAVKSPQAE